MTTQLVDTLRVDHDDGRTTATVSHRVSRPARLLTDHTLASRPAKVAHTAASCF